MTQPISKSRLWTSRVLSALVILFMLMDGIFKIFPNEQVINGTRSLGYSMHQLPVIGTLCLLSVILYAVPQTSVLGAVMLTGYFGGVIATHLRLDNPLFTHLLFPVYLAIFAWGGLWLRNERLRQVFPFVRKDAGNV